MQPMRICIINRKIIAVLLALLLSAGGLWLGISRADAKGSLSTNDYVKNVLVYVKNNAGEEVLIAQLNVSDMLTYLNDNFETYGKVHNYSILDKYVTPVHQEAQGFAVGQMLDYALSKSTLENIKDLSLGFTGNDSVSFWEIDGGGFDAADTYTYNNLYGVSRYNFPALYGSWDYNKHAYANKNAIWESRQEEQVVLSITAYSERYIVSPLYGTGEYNMENYFDGRGLLDTARTVRLMLPMTADDFDNQTSTAMNSRYGICYILFDMANKPALTAEKVARPTYTVIDGDADANDAYDADCWYFTLSCATDGATIYYNDNSVSSYMPTAVYTSGQTIKMAKKGTTPVTFKFRAVKEGCSDFGIQTASSEPEEISKEEIPAGADVWDGTSVDTSWYAGHENDTSYTISTAAQLVGLQSLVNNAGGTGAVTFEGKTVNLGGNIHLNYKAWTPIGNHMGVGTGNKAGGFSIDTNYYYSFNGNFDGNRHTISGLNVSLGRLSNVKAGLFGKTVNAAVRSLTVSGNIANDEAGNRVGGIAGDCINSTIEGCTNKAAITNINYTGGIVGSADSTTLVSDCKNYGKITGIDHIGGIAGEGSPQNCTNFGKVSGDQYIGGICSIGNPGNCVNNGAVNGIRDYIGGITAKGSAVDCINNGKVAAGSYVVGGITGEGSACGSINYGQVSGTDIVGGITGGGSASNCLNYGAVIGSYGDYIGGISGIGSNIVSCLNAGTVNGGPFEGIHKYGVGGIAGYFTGPMTGCVNLGTISGYQYIGGLVGYLPVPDMKGTATITNSYNRGSVNVNSEATGTIYSGGIAGAVFNSKDSASDSQDTFSNCYDANGGAVFGTVGSLARVSKVYYLTGGIEIGSEPAANRLGIDPKTPAQMKADSLVAVLGQYNVNGNGTADGYFVYNPGGYPALYWQQIPISFTLSPATATVVVKNNAGTVVAANPDETYTLILGETYTYEVTADGYFTKTGNFTVTGTETVKVVLDKDKIVTTGPNQIILSWTDNPSTTQSVIWCDNSGNDGYVQYVAENSYIDESSFNSTNQVSATSKTVGYDSAAKTYYEATMTDLAAGTTYYYRVGSSENWSDVAAFTTAPSSAPSFSFMYMGDVQHSTTAAAEYPIWGTLLSDAYVANPNITFGLMGGDMVQSGSDMNDWTYFLSYASDVFSQIPLMTTIGNHESNFTGGKAKYYMDILALPPNGPAGFEEEFYSFDYGSVHVTVLNSWALSSEQKLDEAQMSAISDWITADLAAASNAKFRIVLLHHPAYALAADTVSASVLSNWVPLLEAGKVDLVLCGHQHVYSRSYPMLAGEIDYANGITYVMGNSGQKFYTTADETYSEKTIFSQSTYQIININGDTLSLSTYDSTGNLLDSWSTTAKTTTLTGDVNDDGVVNLDDVNAIYSAVLNCDDYSSIMDINADGIIDMRDTQLVLKIYLDDAA